MLPMNLVSRELKRRGIQKDKKEKEKD